MLAMGYLCVVLLCTVFNDVYANWRPGVTGGVFLGVSKNNTGTIGLMSHLSRPAFQFQKDSFKTSLLRNESIHRPINQLSRRRPQTSPNHVETTLLPGNSSTNPYKGLYRVLYNSPAPNIILDNALSHSGQTEAKAVAQARLVVNKLVTRSSPTNINPSSNARIIYKATQGLEDVRQATEHFLRIRNMSKCQLPQPRIVKVRDYYPDPSKDFLPRCTILHRCADDIGCCDDDSFHCVPNQIQAVMLHFYIIRATRPGLSMTMTDSVEKLVFENHTSCECQPINDEPRSQSLTNVSSSTTSDLSEDVVEVPRENLSETTRPVSSPPLLSTSEETNVSATPIASSTETPISPHHHSNLLNPSKCLECPVPFFRREFSDGRCSCDCFDRQKPCLKIKRGRDPLSEVERRCVEVSMCHIPECEYGQYNYDSGKCPKRPDHYKKVSESREYQNHHHRWNFFERD